MSKKLIYLISFVLLLGLVSNAAGGYKASNPSPVDGEKCVDPNVVLCWQEGDCAFRNSVYLGTDHAAVENAGLLAFEFKGYYLPGQCLDPNLASSNSITLELCTTYYWRVDVIRRPPDLPPVTKGDVWSFTTEGCPCECLSIRVSQESSPNLGDFNENVLGCIKVFETTDSAEDYYRYDDPYPDSFGNPNFIDQHGLIANRSHLFLVCGCDGLSLFIVHDKPGPNNVDSGRAEMRFDLFGDPTGARRTVEDDPNAGDPYDAYTPALGVWGTIFSSRHKWFSERTDGEAITGLDGGGWSMLVEFTEYDSNAATPVIYGLDSWFAYSEDGPTIELALEADRRVRLDCCIPKCNILEYKCRADVKWSQPPVEVNEGIINGWDEVSSYDNSPIVADDWVCADERPIKGIHWWGSFKGWTECAPPNDAPSAFHIGIWTDVPDPDPNDPNTFSHPGELVWEKIREYYVWSFAGYDLDPQGIDGNDACFKFDQLLSQDEWFYQDPNDSNGTVYWLSIAAIYDDGSASCWLVDDFESYANNSELWNKWIDGAHGGNGTGSDIQLETVTVHQGIQSMKYSYNSLPAPHYSQIERIFDPAQDWSAMKCLELWFYGDQDNDLDDMWVVLSDGTNEAQSTYGAYGEDPSDIQIEEWQCWGIPLQDLAAINLLNVESISIGFGDKANPVPVGLGVVYFDDIGLGRERCCVSEPSYPWGWKTRPDCCIDDAVRIQGLDGGVWPPIVGSVWENGEPIEYPEGTSWDMAFVLTANREYSLRRWSWPDEEAAIADVYTDGIINFKDIGILANQWLEEADMLCP